MARRPDLPGAISTAMDVASTSIPSVHPSAVATRGATPLHSPSAPSSFAFTHPHTSHLPSSVQAKLLLLQGKLLRRDRTFLTWKWRDFYLEKHRLQYFNEKGVRKGEIVITPTTPIMMRLLNEPKPHAFLVFIKDEKLTVAAATAADRQKWIDVFTEVFHASVEDCQTTTASKVGSGEKQEKKRTRPTFLPIPDMTSDDEVGARLGASGSRTPVAQAPGSQGSTTSTTRSSLLRRPSDPMHPSAFAATSSNAKSTSVMDGSMSGEERRSLFRSSEGAIDIGAPRTKFIALKEQYSNVTFPRTLANGDVLVGVGPLVRRMGWTDERILAVGLYVDAEAAVKELHRFHLRNLKSLRGDQSFYDFLMQSSKFRRSFVVTSRKRVSKSVLIALLHDEIAPRVSGSTDALHTFLGFFEKSLRKAESLMLRIYPEGGRLEFRLRGQQYPPIASSMLCQCIQAIFFDVNSIQQDAKRRLIERFPLLWGIEEPEDVLLALDNGDRDVHHLNDEPKDIDTLSDSEDGEDDDADDEQGGTGRIHIRTRDVRSSTGADRGSLDHERGMSMKEKLDELDEREHEYLRRESRSLGVHFGPIVDKDSNAYFRSDLLVDGSALLGTWSQKIAYVPIESDISRDSASQAPPERTCVVSIGLYAESGGASETLLKYKGLSVGSILQDPDFFARFADGAFSKHLVFKVHEAIDVMTLIEHFTARVRRRGSGAGGSHSEAGRSSDSKVRTLLSKLEEERAGQLRPEDELQVSILPDGRMTLTIARQLIGDDYGDVNDDDEARDTSTFPPIDALHVAGPPFSIVFQGIFYGYHTFDPASRARLMERLPNLLDLAKDDLAHTYHDEIQMLKENYKRQLPELRLKAGYLLISFEKKKMAKNADGVREQTIKASKWSKRWCRLDGVTFSYFSHKHSKKPREIFDLTSCTVSEITSTSTAAGLAPFVVAKNARPSIRIGIEKSNGEVLALKTESIYEGVEWLESLVEASNVVRQPASSVQMGEREDDARAIESSEGADADESSGAVDDDVATDTPAEDDTDAGETLDDLEEPEEQPESGARSRRLAGARTRMLLEDDKHGSLLSWIREDPRHAFIFALLAIIAWLITSMETNTLRPIGSDALATNSSLVEL